MAIIIPNDICRVDSVPCLVFKSWFRNHELELRRYGLYFPSFQKRLDTGTFPTTFDPKYVHKRVLYIILYIILYNNNYIYQYNITFLGRLSCVNTSTSQTMYMFLPPEWLRMNVGHTLRPIRWDI